MKSTIEKILVKKAENLVTKSASISFLGEVEMPECLKKEAMKKMMKK